MRRLERGEGLAASRGVPYITASCHCTLLVHIDGTADAEQDILRGRYLIRAHDHEVLVDREDTEARSGSAPYRITGI